MLSETDIQQIAEIDRQNMAGMMLAMGNVYPLEKRMADVLKEIERGTVFITVMRNDTLLAYLSYRITGNELKVMSIQLAPNARRLVLKELMRKVLLALKNEAYTHVVSKVFSNNQGSLRFHNKLGFEIKDEKGGICYFSVNRNDLLRKLSNLI